MVSSLEDLSRQDYQWSSIKKKKKKKTCWGIGAGGRDSHVEFGGAVLTVQGDLGLWYCASSSRQGWELCGENRNLEDTGLIICLGEGLDIVACSAGQVCLWVSNRSWKNRSYEEK